MKKSTITAFVAALAFIASSNAQTSQWSGPLNTTGAINRGGWVGIGKSTAPAQYPLEVGSGGIGINYGDIIGIVDANITGSQRKILQNGWDQDNGDFLSFFTPGNAGAINAQEKLRITSNGNVSIGGYPIPAAKLHVFEGSALPTGNNSEKLLATFQCSVDGGNTFKSNLWLVRDKTYSTTNDWYSAKLHDGISIDDQFKIPGNNTKTWWERNPNQDIQAWGNGSTTHMMMLGGRLSLNNPSSSPAARLDVKETDGAYHAIIARAYHTYDFGYAISSRVRMNYTKALSVTHEYFGGNQTQLNPKETFVVYGNGTTRIGEKMPLSTGVHNDAMLSVYGKVLATSFYVTVAPGVWADYVFEEDYELTSLRDTEDFVKQKKHLPGVPSASDVEQNGVDILEANVVLLKKLEEAYLHIIELNKRVEQLELKDKK